MRKKKRFWITGLLSAEKSREDSLFAGKELYRIGKNKHSDIVLETSDDHVSRDFLTLEPVSGKNIFCLKRVREDFVLPVWSEEEGKWTPHAVRFCLVRNSR